MDLNEKTILDLVDYLFRSDKLRHIFDQYEDRKQPNFGELNSRLSEDIKRYGGAMPQQAAIAWHSYLTCLVEYALLPAEHLQKLLKQLPPLEDDSILNVFLDDDKEEG